MIKYNDIIQESINTDKYRALAYLTNPQGNMMLRKVNDRWYEWINIVSTAPWLRHWSKSYLLNSNEYAHNPAGQPTERNKCVATIGNRTVDVASISHKIFIDAVWGFGIEDWLRYPWGIDGNKQQYPTIVATILDAQGLTQLPISRKQMWDRPIYMGCGLEIPPEFGVLDRWLDKLWYEVLDEVAQQERDQLKKTLPTAKQKLAEKLKGLNNKKKE